MAGAVCLQSRGEDNSGAVAEIMGAVPGRYACRGGPEATAAGPATEGNRHCLTGACCVPAGQDGHGWERLLKRVRRRYHRSISAMAVNALAIRPRNGRTACRDRYACLAVAQDRAGAQDHRIEGAAL